MSKNLKQWDLRLNHAEFAYNWAPTYATSHSPFEACYGVNPLTLIDLIPLPIEHKVSFETEERAKEIKKLHKQIQAQGEKVNASDKASVNKYRKPMVFNLGDWVWFHLRKKRFSSRKQNKLIEREEGPFKVLERIRANANKLELPRNMNVSVTFNVGDLAPYVEGDFEDFRANLS